jgi:phosphoglycerate kinase
MARFKTLNDLDVKGRRVLLRADLNVPMRDGRLTDTTRIDRLAPSIDELAQKGGRIVLLSHFGRPKGKRVPELSLAPLAGPVSAALGGRSVVFAEDCVGPAAAALVETLGGGQVALLENLRFHPGEEANDPAFAQELAALGDLYVNDAFSAAHRAHASVEALARLLPAAAGRLMQAELEHLAKALEAPARPVAAIVGGAKISTKLDLLGNLVRRVDMLAIGGAMANTFLGALGVAVGRSLCEHDMAETARRIVAQAKAARCELVLPTDAQVAAALEAEVANRSVSIKQVPAEAMILDLGPASAGDLARRLGQFRTLVWNGPLGCFEVPPFDAGTNAVAQAAAEQTRAGRLLSVAGGGDTVAALSHAGVADDFSYVSTAGGAFLEWLEGKTLPGVAALEAAAAS